MYAEFFKRLECLGEAAEFWSGRPAALLICSRAGVRVYAAPSRPKKGGYSKSDLLLVSEWPSTAFRLFYLRNARKGCKKIRFSWSVIKTRL